MRHFDIDDIIKMIFDGHTMSSIARHYNVSYAVIAKRIGEHNIDYKKLKKLCATSLEKSL
jgi:Mor family transcriptional regulator